MKPEDIVYQVAGKFFDIFFISFPSYKLFPRFKEIFFRNNIYIFMGQLSFHNGSGKSNHAHDNPPILNKCIAAYKLWHDFIKHFPKTSRYTLGGKIDENFLKLLENIFRATYSDDKSLLLEEANIKLDIIKFYLRISWETKALDNKKYILLSEQLDEVGRMLGGWKKHSQKQTSAK